ncbi:MAG: stage II sporulation protein M [Gemmatimonadetes bacterium]|nr:stage II sporulation protein M [Gemmatimonadota bacterium]
MGYTPATITSKLPFLLSFASIIVGLGVGAVMPLDMIAKEPMDPGSSTFMPDTRPFLDGGDEWKFIIGNNLLVSLKILFGLLSFGLVSVVILGWTGTIVAWSTLSALDSGASIYAIAALILPHGVIELAGFVFFGALGCEGLVLFCQKLKYDTWLIDSNRLTLNVRRLVTGFLLISAASIIETFVTGQIANKIN